MASQSRNTHWQQVENVASIFAPRQFALFETLRYLLLTFLSWYTQTIKPFIRHSFGERGFTLLTMCLGYLTMGMFKSTYLLFSLLFSGGGQNVVAYLAYNGGLASLFRGGAGGFLYHLYVWSFLALSIWHLWAIHKRNKAGIPWHSRSFGTSWLEKLPWHKIQTIPYVGAYLPRIDDFALYRFIEPGFVFLLGDLLWYLDPLLGWWLMIASVALFVESNMVYHEMRLRFLDLMDGNIESRYLSLALSGANKRDTAGFSVIPVPIPMEGMLDEVIDIAATVQETLGLDQQEV